MMTSLTGIKKLLVVLSVSLFLYGCYAGTFGSVVTPEQKAKIQVGKTTKVELLRELGTPDQILELGGGKEEFSYIKEAITSYMATAVGKSTEFWLVLDNSVVTDFGERPTTKKPKYIK